MHTLLASARQYSSTMLTSCTWPAGQVHDVNILDEFLPCRSGSVCIRHGSGLCLRIFGASETVFTLCSAFFVESRTKKNVLLQRRYSHPVDRSI